MTKVLKRRRMSMSFLVPLAAVWINSFMIFFLLMIPNVLYFSVRVQMNIQMMKMSAGKFRE